MSDLRSTTRYDPTDVEPRIVEKWLQSGLFHPAPEGTPEENYSIAIPPPNVTGVLHMGHALNNSIQDCLARYHRMRGRRTKWILGTDHAGIATQTQVERALIAEGTHRRDLGREAFVARVWEWRARYGGTIIEQLKRLGASADFETERFTLDDDYVRAVLKVFVSLYEKGYIYRDRYMVNWDPGTGSAISDLEVEQREVKDTLYYIDYPLDSGSGAITVATVRPETMLADSAIAVHPDDDRYRRLIGEKAILPLVGRKLKIIADEYVRPDFGTGALKITPAHDPNDFEIGRRHGLAQPSVIGEDGRITAEAPERFRGMTAADAQKAVVAELSEQGLIDHTEPYEHTVPFSHRSGQRIEPLISLQWFMAMEELARPAIEAVTSGRVRFHPANQAKVYLDWMENIRPWCISRQLWWGHQLPVWYRDLDTYVGTEPPKGEGWQRDPDVLDTWFSSALWPFATLGWPQDTPELKAFYPTDALVTGRDIIFLWVARMIMMGLEFTGTEPFSDVHITSIIQAPDGRRMSKSLGTGIDPIDLIEGGPRPPVFAQGKQPAGDFPAYGADAVRWGLLAMSSGQDVRFSEDKVAQGQQLTNKLWNAARLILTGVGDNGGVSGAGSPAMPTAVEDRWILSRLERARSELSAAIERFDFSHAALGLYDFVYGDLCDWYLELVKPRLRAGEAELSATLLHVLTETVALAHPLIPFETEEIYSHIPGSQGLLAERVSGGQAPEVDETAEAAVQHAIQAIQELRRWRDLAGVKAGAMLDARLEAPGYEATIEHVGRLARLTLGGASNGAEPVASVPIPGGQVQIFGGAGFDAEGAAAGRAERRKKIEGEIERAERKLANPGFVAKARPEVVQAERDKLARLTAELEDPVTRAHPSPAHPFTPSEAERYILSLERFGMRFELDRMRRLMTALGHPQRAFASIHVVGTNGKSSTTRMIASILGHHGLRTGAYLSPHLVSFGERIRIGDRDLTATEFAAAVTRAAHAADLVNRALDADDRVTQFEVLTAAAYSEMARQGVECAVIEAGLGGRYDATNVIPSTVQVLTSVGLEHTRWLGPTLTAIAGEKLDVVQPGRTLVLGSGLAPEVVAVAERVCAERGTRIVYAGIDPGVPVVGAAGAYQRRNFALARAAARAYLEPARALDPAAVAAAAVEVRVPGRLEQIDSDPLTVLDVAHNPEGMRALTESLPELSRGRAPVVAVVSVLDDKDAAGMLAELMPACDRLVLTATQNPRVLPPATLKSLAAQLDGPPTEVVGDPWRALARARELAAPGGLVVVTGSQYLIGDLLAGGRRERASSL